MRSYCLLASLLLSALGGLFILLVADWNDNAYLWLYFAAVLMWASAPGFFLLSLLPYSGLRTIVGAGSLALLILFACCTAFLLATAVVLYPAGSYDSTTVFRQHLFALAAFAAGISLVVYLLSRKER